MTYDTAELSARAEVEELIYLHSWLLDHGRGEEIADLYTEDGVMLGVGPDRVGREGVLAYARARKPNRTARHVCMNIRITKTDEEHMAGAFMIALYRSDDRPPRMRRRSPLLTSTTNTVVAPTVGGVSRGDRSQSSSKPTPIDSSRPRPRRDHSARPKGKAAAGLRH